jgi:hypothetical protein
MTTAAYTKAVNVLLQSGKYSDLTLRCGGREFRVHRPIVCPHSPVFEAICSGEFKESTRTNQTNLSIGLTGLTGGFFEVHRA